MSFNVLQLLVKAYNASGINSQGFKSLTPLQTENGLYLFNVMLSDKTVDTSMLLYWKKLDGAFIGGTDTYFIPRLIQVQVLTFFLSDGTVRYPTQAQNLEQFMGSARSMNTDSLPFTYYVNKVNGGANLYVYFVPNQDYPYQIWGQFELQNVTLFEDIETLFPLYYRNFLTLQLAKEICVYGNYSVPAPVIEKLAEYRKTIGVNGIVQDLSMNMISSIRNPNFINWGQINIGEAYIPGTWT